MCSALDAVAGAGETHLSRSCPWKEPNPQEEDTAYRGNVAGRATARLEDPSPITIAARWKGHFAEFAFFPGCWTRSMLPGSS